MAKPQPQNLTPHEPEKSEVVYRRADLAGGQRSAGETIQARARALAPAITPLIIGFALLLGLIMLQEYLSIHRTDEVSFRVLDLENQHTARLSLLLKLRLALTKLDNEARERQGATSRNELKPPFAFRLGRAHDEINELIRQLEKPPLSEDPSWQHFRKDLQAYVEVTEDLRRYTAEGYDKFRTVDTELDDLLNASSQDQEQIFRDARVIEQEAARSIRLWSFLALLVGSLVAAGTIWEVQRRFRQMRLSTDEARRERAFTNQLLEGMVSAVAAIDESDRIRSANAAFFQIFPGASIGASVYEKFANDDALRMLEAATSTRVTKGTYRGRWQCRLSDEEKTFDVYSSPLAIDGEQGQIITLVDATQAAESERVLRRNESLAAVGQATAQVAHEIRNPLGSIRLGVSMLRDSVTDVEALNTIELVERGIKHLNKLVVDVTQFSRQKNLERAPVDLNELIEMSLNLVADRVRDKDTPIEKHFSEGQLVGQWDADQLRQVFMNIIANAVDASVKHSPVTISTETVSLSRRVDGTEHEDQRFARVVVADQGKGIDKPALERVFEPFFTTKKRGTGLGLAIVKQIVEQHGGDVTMQSEPGKGARVTIDLPL
ncbi:MAG TPA: ATP-binding protein [Pyrinomonadaceae bacterium]|nr:ATP-binding protein [Pyrinomonadaceae bacterium]